MVRAILCIVWLVSNYITAQYIKWVDHDIRDIDFGAGRNLVQYPIDLSFITETATANLSTQSREGCLLDAMKLSYRTLTSSISEIRLAIVMEGSHENIKMGSFDMQKLAHRTKSWSFENKIRCEINEEFCSPQVDNVTLQSSEKPSISIQFNRETNKPSLISSRLIVGALLLNPPLRGGAVGEWTDSKTLKIAVDDMYVRDIIETRERGEPITVDVRHGDDSPYMEHEGKEGRQVKFAIRPQEHGSMKLFTVDATALFRTSRILQYDVLLCGDSPIPHSQAGSGAKSLISNTFPSSSVSLRGILAINGRDPIKFPQDACPGMGTGNWALSFWIQLLSPPSGAHRSFFYKGTGNSPQRTPSAWLLPDSNRLAIRVSTTSYHDVGTETLLEVPTQKWTFVTFVFRNYTAEENSMMFLSDSVTRNGDGQEVFPSTNRSGDDQNAFHNYTISTYIDGRLDVSMTFAETVVGNDGMLHLFKDVSHDGPRAFVRDLVIWDAPLNPSHVKELYVSDKGLPIFAGLQDLHATSVTVEVESSDVNPVSAPSPQPLSLMDYLFRSSSATTAGLEQPTSIDVARQLLQKAEEGRISCNLTPAQRLDLLAESSSHGSSEALFLWAKLLGYGAEEPGVTCGISSSLADDVEGDKYTTAILPDEQARAVMGFLWAADAGISKALFPLAMALLNGIGASPLVAATQNTSDWGTLEIPLPQWLRAPRKQSAFHKALAQVVSDAVERCNRNVASFTSRGDLPIGTSVFCPHPGHKDGMTRIAMGLLHVASALGEVEADAALAYRYQHGLAVEQNLETAAQYARRAVAVAAENFHRVGGQPVLESDRIDDSTEGDIDKGNQGNDDELILHQKLRAEEGDVSAMVYTADLYYYGARGLPRDQIEALRLYQLAADTHDPMGLCGAAAMLLKGEGTEKNVSRAVELYNEAAALGSVKALNGLGYIYFYGDAVPKNETRAFHYFLSASEYSLEGDSFTNAAYCLFHGIGVPRDLSRAAKLYDTAARKFGAFAAINALSSMHLDGQGVVRSPAQALFFMDAAISIGPWAGYLRRALDAYLLGSRDSVSSAARDLIGLSGKEALYRGSSLRRSLSSYLYASEFGYEVASSNVAFILRRKGYMLGNITFPQSHALQLRLLALSAYRGKVDSWAAIGNVFFDLAKSKKAIAKQFAAGATTILLATDEQCGGADICISWTHTSCPDEPRNVRSDATTDWEMSRREAETQSVLLLATSVWFYSKGSGAGDTLASLYTGMMTHLGIGTPRSLVRAQRYYTLALRQAQETNTLHPQFRSLAKLLLWCAKASEHGHFLRNLIVPLEQVAKYAFDI